MRISTLLKTFTLIGIALAKNQGNRDGSRKKNGQGRLFALDALDKKLAELEKFLFSDNFERLLHHNKQTR